VGGEAVVKLGAVLPIMAILAAMWVLILVGSVLIFYFIVPMEIPSLNRATVGVLKVILGAGLAALWLFIFLKLRDVYASRLFR
jgi:hypothetical protein